MNLKEMLAAALKRLEAAQTALNTGIGSVDAVKTASAEVKELSAKLEALKESETITKALGEKKQEPKDVPAKSLGAHVVKTLGARLKASRNSPQMTDMSMTAPEFKAATDTHVTGTLPEHLKPVTIDRNIIREYEPPLRVADFLGAGALDSPTLVYFTEQLGAAVEGAFTTVAEEGKKPQLHFPGYKELTETVRKIAGYIKLSTEMLEDEAFLVTEINNRLLRELAKFEENQLLHGDGQGTNVLGLLNREGLQKLESKADLVDDIYRACSKVAETTGLEADGILINPADYQELRLKKDTNGQYLAGGPFTGQYGVGGILQNPPLWGKTTIVTPAIEKGKVLVGAGKQAATVYHKGGVAVRTAFQNEDDFTHNRVTILAEERLALAVYMPSAFCLLEKTAA